MQENKNGTKTEYLRVFSICAAEISYWLFYYLLFSAEILLHFMSEASKFLMLQTFLFEIRRLCFISGSKISELNVDDKD